MSMQLLRFFNIDSKFFFQNANSNIYLVDTAVSFA